MNWMASLTSILKHAFFLLAIGALCLGCNREDTPNDKPVIRYGSYSLEQDSTGKDNLLKVMIDYEDGDGDIGYREQDTTGVFELGQPFFYNLHVDFYSIQNGTKVYYLDQFSGDTIRFDQRLQSITPTGRYKSINGTMEVSIDFALLKINGHFPDNCQVEIWLNDRALNQSDIVSTPLIDLDL